MFVNSAYPVNYRAAVPLSFGGRLPEARFDQLPELFAELNTQIFKTPKDLAEDIKFMKVMKSKSLRLPESLGFGPFKIDLTGILPVKLINALKRVDLVELERVEKRFRGLEQSLEMENAFREAFKNHEDQVKKSLETQGIRTVGQLYYQMKMITDLMNGNGKFSKKPAVNNFINMNLQPIMSVKINDNIHKYFDVSLEILRRANNGETITPDDVRSIVNQI